MATRKPSLPAGATPADLPHALATLAQRAPAAGEAGGKVRLEAALREAALLAPSAKKATTKKATIRARMWPEGSTRTTFSSIRLRPPFTSASAKLRPRVALR